MATKLQSTMAHTLGYDKALEAALKVAKRAEEKASVNYRVQGSRIDFNGKGVKGHLQVSDTDVKVEIELGLLMRPMKSLIEKKLPEYFDRYFAASPL